MKRIRFITFLTLLPLILAFLSVDPSGTVASARAASDPEFEFYGQPGSLPTLSAPNQPVLVSPANGSTTGSTSPNLSVTVSDQDADNLTVTYYGRPVSGAGIGEDFTIIAMPDTQHYTDNPSNYHIFSAQTQWIVNNKAARNIVFVTGLGDCVQNGNNNGDDTEWDIADEAYNLIEDPFTTLLADGIPYGLAVGNHDQSPIGGGSSASTTSFNVFFGESRFLGRGYYGGHHGSDNDNNFELFSASGMDFIIIHLEYDESPEQPVLDWADNLLTTYSDRRAIVSTHYLINTGNPASFGVQGLAIYNALKDHANLFLMLGGHVAGEGQRQDVADNGNTVYSLLSDYQGMSNGGDGWLRIMTFSPATDQIQVQTYSPTRKSGNGDFETDADSQFTLSYVMDPEAAFEVIGSQTGIASGSTTSLNWSGLAEGTEYEWYVTVSDGSSIITGPTWHFTTTEPETYEVTATTSGHGTVINTPGNPYLPGHTATLKPAAAAGWTFAGWNGPDADDLANNGNGTWDLVMDDDKAVTASFSQDEYEVTATTSGSGTVSHTPGNPYTYGETATLEPLATTGWGFAGWSGPDAGDLSNNGDGTWDLVMDGDKAVTATFSQDEYEVTATTSGSGTVINTPGNPYLPGQTATLKPLPNAGWTFAGWSGPDAGDLSANGDGTWDLVMNGGKSITATFERHKVFLPIIVTK